jgi:hypothetical protein
VTPANLFGEASIGSKNNLTTIFAVASDEEVLLAAVFLGFPCFKRW